MSTARILVVIVAGVVALAVVFFVIARMRSGRGRDWVSTVGVVVDRKTGQPTGFPAIYPTFQWRDQHGQVHQLTSSVRQSLPPAPGRQVPVRYNPNDPSRAYIDTFVQSGKIFYLVGAIILGVGLSGGLVALALALAFRQG